ncbi:hypothetical protein H634G_10417 [Metarhizium anisopliae BRIP 53293]|uniref:Uncharacterized protein n=1 Tax=Metarhizium anisopliae BRIP 53293 TaxID=1291518 RepID=A0A0D9NK67_METAN|nr:hypothetical protein H634G_10417 [Metarhizium anisopliae BRIP 53293]
MGLIKTLIVSGAAIAVAKEFNKKRQDKKHSNGSQCGQDQFNYGPPHPQQHQGYSQPNYQQYAPQEERNDLNSVYSRHYKMGDNV